MRTVATERLLVRNFKTEDWKDLKGYISNKDAFEFEPRWDSSDEACKKAVEDFSRGDTFLAVQLKETGKMIGHVYFSKEGPDEFMTSELGYIFNPLYWGNGYAVEALKAVIQYAFDELNMHRIIAKTNPDNIKSWKLMERLSMRREGHSLKAVTFKKSIDGKPIWWDEYQYAILKEEWKKFDCKIV